MPLESQKGNEIKLDIEAGQGGWNAIKVEEGNKEHEEDGDINKIVLV